MPARLKWYVGAVGVAGLLVLVALIPTIDVDRIREVGGAIALFTVFVVGGELTSIRLQHGNRVKDLAVTTTFAYVLVFVFASVVADLGRGKPAVKILFNAAQYVLALAAGGAVYHLLGGGYEITSGTLPALAAGGLAFMLVNHLLVSIVISLDQGLPILQGLRRDDLRLELGSSAMVLALAPVAVVVAEKSLLLLPALILPLGAVYLASKGEMRAKRDQAEAEEAAERQRRLTVQEQEVVRRLQETDRLKAELVAMGIQQSERLHRMIEQLLAAARFEQADGVASLAAARIELDATDLVRQAGAEARARHHERRIAIETNGALPVRVAQDAVVQVLGNLLDNACKYSPDGEQVRLSGTREGAEAVLAVEDTGPGVPEADRERIFDRFTQLERSSLRRSGGVGLGLYIARQLARSQDGDLLVVDPAGGRGARFELHLPLLADGAGS